MNVHWFVTICRVQGSGAALQLRTTLRHLHVAANSCTVNHLPDALQDAFRWRGLQRGKRRVAECFKEGLQRGLEWWTTDMLRYSWWHYISIFLSLHPSSPTCTSPSLTMSDRIQHCTPASSSSGDNVLDFRISIIHDLIWSDLIWSDLIISYHIISCHLISYHAVSYHIIWHHTISYPEGGVVLMVWADERGAYPDRGLGGW